MKQCVCGETVFSCDIGGYAKVTIDEDGIVRFNSVSYDEIRYVRCSSCKAVYRLINNKITIPKDTVIRLCSNCFGGVACTSCLVMPYRSQYNILRIEDEYTNISLRKLLPPR